MWWSILDRLLNDTPLAESVYSRTCFLNDGIDMASEFQMTIKLDSEQFCYQSIFNSCVVDCNWVVCDRFLKRECDGLWSRRIQQHEVFIATHRHINSCSLEWVFAKVDGCMVCVVECVMSTSAFLTTSYTVVSPAYLMHCVSGLRSSSKCSIVGIPWSIIGGPQFFSLDIQSKYWYIWVSVWWRNFLKPALVMGWCQGLKAFWQDERVTFGKTSRWKPISRAWTAILLLSPGLCVMTVAKLTGASMVVCCFV